MNQNIFDVITMNGEIVSSILVPENDSIFISKIYGKDYIDNLSECKGEEVKIIKRIEIDKHYKHNKQNEII
jgi:hypothetical protein